MARNLSVVIDPEVGAERPEREEAYESAFALLPFPSLLIGENSEIEDANDAVATLLGIPVPQLVDGSLADIVASDSRGTIQETVSGVFAHGFRYGAGRLLRHDGYQVPVHWIGVRLQSERLLFTVRDVDGWRDALVNLSLADPSTDPAGAPWVKGEDIVEAGDLVIDLAQRSVAVRGNPLRLTPREFAVLEILARNRGRVVFSDQLVTRVWGEADRPNLALVRTVVSRLRQKLETDSSHPQYIETVPGAGYLLKGSDE
ncbi:MAG: winged helix-turn-helix domain-containing protein [Gemmatimonadota bacterium]